MSEPWAYIAHKDNHWAGIIAADIDVGSLNTFFSDFAGFAITPVPDRETYLRMIGTMACWHDHPEYKARKASKSTTPRAADGVAPARETTVVEPS